MKDSTDLIDIYGFIPENSSWRGDKDTFVSKAVNLCNMTIYQHAYASDGLDLAKLLSGSNVYGVENISIENLQGYISTQLQKRGIPISDISVKRRDNTSLFVRIEVSNKKQSIIEFLVS